MKNLLFTLLIFSFATSLIAQDTNKDLGRKKGILIETGYNLISGFSSGSGVSVIADSDGNSVTSFGVDGGYFITNNLALKLKLALISSGGNSVTNFAIGTKYYIIGSIPVEVSGGILGADGFSNFYGNISAGYAISLADNINLEPGIGLLFAEGGGLFEFNLNFALFF